MAGKMNFTTSIDTRYGFFPNYAKAFCQGLTHRAAGTLLSAPVADNPYSSETDIGHRLAWLEGWLQADNAAGVVPIGVGHDGVANCALDPALVISP